MEEDGKVRAESLEEAVRLAGADMVGLVCEAVGMDAREPGLLREQAEEGLVRLDPYLTREEEDIMRREAVSMLAERGRDLAWVRYGAGTHAAAPLLTLTGPAAEALLTLTDELNERFEDHEALGAKSAEIAEGVLRILDGKGCAGGVLDVSGIEPLEALDQIRDTCDFTLAPLDALDVAAMRMETTLLVGDVPGGFSADLHASRHALDAAFRALEGDGDALGKAADLIDGSSLGWLCSTQGTTLARVLAREGDGFAEAGPFASSLRDALWEAEACRGGFPHVAMLGEVTVDDYLDLLAASQGLAHERSVTVPAGEDGALVYIFDPCCGAGSSSIELERPIEVCGEELSFPMPDWSVERFDGFWTVQECFGLTHAGFETELAGKTMSFGRSAAKAAR